jgi:hypothetical protein
MIDYTKPLGKLIMFLRTLHQKQVTRIEPMKEAVSLVHDLKLTITNIGKETLQGPDFPRKGVSFTHPLTPLVIPICHSRACQRNVTMGETAKLPKLMKTHT